jgi:hypothetical protein
MKLVRKIERYVLSLKEKRFLLYRSIKSTRYLNISIDEENKFSLYFEDVLLLKGSIVAVCFKLYSYIFLSVSRELLNTLFPSIQNLLQNATDNKLYSNEANLEDTFYKNAFP